MSWRLGSRGLHSNFINFWSRLSCNRKRLYDNRKSISFLRIVSWCHSSGLYHAPITFLGVPLSMSNKINNYGKKKIKTSFECKRLIFPVGPFIKCSFFRWYVNHNYTFFGWVFLASLSKCKCWLPDCPDCPNPCATVAVSPSLWENPICRRCNFLVAGTQLYMRLCLSVGSSVGPLIRP